MTELGSLKIKVDTSESVKQVDNLTSSINELSEMLQKMGMKDELAIVDRLKSLGSISSDVADKFENLQNAFSNGFGIKGATKEFEALNSAMDKFARSVDGLKMSSWKVDMMAGTNVNSKNVNPLYKPNSEYNKAIASLFGNVESEKDIQVGYQKLFDKAIKIFDTTKAKEEAEWQNFLDEYYGSIFDTAILKENFANLKNSQGSKVTSERISDVINRTIMQDNSAINRVIAEQFGQIYDDSTRKADYERLFAQAGYVSKSSTTEFKDSESSVDRFASILTRLKSKLNGVTKASQKTTKSINKLGKSSKNVSVFFDKFVNRLKSIIGYRIIRGTLSKISQGLDEGIQNLVKYEQALKGVAGTKATEIMTALSTSLQTLKNNIGATAMSVLGTLQPALQTLMSWFSTAITYINQFFVALQGGKTYKKATDAVYNYGKAVEGTAKKLQLLGFDELNVLSDNSSTNEGGTAYADMFEDAEVDSSITSIVDKLESMKDKVSNIFKSLVDKVKAIFEDIKGLLPAILTGDWETVRDITAKLAEDLCALIATIADSIKLLIPDACDLLKGILVGVLDFAENIIVSFSEWLDSKIGIDLSVITNTIKDVFAGLKNIASNVCDNLKLILGGVLDFISGVFTGNWTKAWNGILNIIKGVFDIIANTIVTAITVAINTCINVINWFLSGINKIFGTNWQIGKITLPTEKITTTITKTENFKALKADRMASGGTPEVGTLFWAGEAGAEVIGSVGGRTTVYNTDQLGNALSNANADVVNAINTLIGVVRTKSGNVTISASDIRKAVNSSSMRVGV